ncbi:MAG: alpha/beta hydrolase [Herbinix sp.]|nr:alpha/beta hydrolase [Herbinix sp.]
MIKLISVLLFEWLFCLSNLLIKPRMITYDKGFKREVKCNKFDSKTYHEWMKETFRLKSDFGYVISCELIEPPEKMDSKNSVKKIAILCHGLGCAKYESIKYAELFIKLGFTVLIYDHRNHGLSGKAYTTMGYYEKYDLKKVTDWCIDHFGKECKIITHGESMGAATVLMHLEIDERVKLAIADCSYSDLNLLLRHQLKQYYHLPCFLIPIESCITYIRAGFWFNKVSPIKAVYRSKTPVLFIHGKRDSFVPTDMSRQMYACKKKNKAIYLVAKARHAESYCTNREEYKKVVEQFLEKYLK